MIAAWTPKRRTWLTIGLVAALALLFVLMRPHLASAAACTQPTTDYGNVSGLSVNLPASTTYRIWTRMVAADTTNNTYLLQIDGSSCYTVGGSSVQTYPSGATNYFSTSSTNTSDWVDKQSSGTVLDVSLTAGTHTLKLIGNAPNVVVDRVILTQDTSCVPQGTGDNCANPPDTTPPVVSITAPANNSTISTTTTATANATDDVAVQKVEFYIDGVLKATDTASPYTYSINPASLSVGAHALVAKAYDTTGNSASSTANFTVADATDPVATITAPANNTTQKATIAVTGTASDNVGVTQVTLRVDNVNIATDSASPYSFNLDTTALTNAVHTIVLRAFDAAGNSGDSSPITITVNNTTTPPPDTTVPTVSLTAPAAGASLSGTITMSANAADASGIKQVQFYVDGTLKATDTSPPYTYSLNTTSLSNSSHSFKAIATDNSTNQNTGSSATVTASVSNITYRAADIDMNGTVDLQDFHLLVIKFGASGSNLGRADIDGNGKVDLQDFHLLATQFGT